MNGRLEFLGSREWFGAVSRLTLGAGRQCCLQSISSKTCSWLSSLLLLPLIIPNTTALVALRTVCRVAEEYTPSLNLPRRRARFSTPGRSRGTRRPDAGSLGLTSSTPLRSKSKVTRPSGQGAKFPVVPPEATQPCGAAAAEVVSLALLALASALPALAAAPPPLRSPKASASSSSSFSSIPPSMAHRPGFPCARV